MRHLWIINFFFIISMDALSNVMKDKRKLLSYNFMINLKLEEWNSSPEVNIIVILHYQMYVLCIRICLIFISRWKLSIRIEVLTVVYLISRNGIIKCRELRDLLLVTHGLLWQVKIKLEYLILMVINYIVYALIVFLWP